jgi:hypothetical protein
VIKIAALALALALAGCATSTTSTGTRRTIQVADTVVGDKVVPLTTTTTETTQAQAQTLTTPDGAMIGEQMGRGIRAIGGTAIPGLDLAGLISSGAAAVTAAGVGYLAHKKRQQTKA